MGLAHASVAPDDAAAIKSALIGGDPRIVVVGEVGRQDLSLYPLPDGSVGNRLMKSLGQKPVAFLHSVRCNLCSGEWDGHQARATANLVVREYRGSVIVMLGRKVAEAFGWDVKPFGISLIEGSAAVHLPHLANSRAWSKPDAATRARRSVASAVRILWA